jgi:hypothetical protein
MARPVHRRVSEAVGLMFSLITDGEVAPLPTTEDDVVWVVISSDPCARISQTWAALVSAHLCRRTGEFSFLFDARRLGLGDSVLVRYLDESLGRMVTFSATVACRVDVVGELSSVRVIAEDCACGSVGCSLYVCFDAGRFVSQSRALPVAA